MSITTWGSLNSQSYILKWIEVDWKSSQVQSPLEVPFYWNYFSLPYESNTEMSTLCITGKLHWSRSFLMALLKEANNIGILVLWRVCQNLLIFFRIHSRRELIHQENNNVRFLYLSYYIILLINFKIVMKYFLYKCVIHVTNNLILNLIMLHCYC